MQKLPEIIKDEIRAYVATFRDKMGYREALYPKGGKYYREATAKHREELKAAKKELKKLLENGIDEAALILTERKKEVAKLRNAEKKKPKTTRKRGDWKREGNCPHCGSDRYMKTGSSNKNVQRYLCSLCGKTFSERRMTPTVNEFLNDSDLAPEIKEIVRECLK